MMFASTVCYEKKHQKLLSGLCHSGRGGKWPRQNINKEREEGEASVKLRKFRRLTKIQGLRPSIVYVVYKKKHFQLSSTAHLK